VSLWGIVVYILDYFSKETVEGLLQKWIPLNLKINLLLILIAVFICYKDFVGFAKKFVNKSGVLLPALFLISLAIASLVAPQTHRIFYDEDIYANMGQNMALKNQTGYCNYGTFEYGEYHPHWISYNKQPSGWPFLISLVFQFFGTDERYAFFLNNVLFSAGVLVVFSITWHLCEVFFTAFIAALAFSIIPHNLIWANTAAAETSAGLLTGIVVLSLIVFLKRKKDRHLFLLMLLIPFACQMRSESLLILGWVLISILLYSPRILAEKRLWTLGLLTTVFLLPHILHTLTVSGHSWGAEGDKFSLQFFWNNLYTNGIYYFNNRCFPVLLTVLALTGLLYPRESYRPRFLIFLWFILFWGIFLFFYAGSYEYGADVRFSLLSFMPLSILAGIGAGFIRGKIVIRDNRYARLASPLLILLILAGFLKFLPLVRQVGQEAWGARHDHTYAKAFIERIPRRSMVLTQTPTMFLVWGQNAIQTYAGINYPDLIQDLMEKYQGHVYFHYNYWCNVKSERNRRLCKAIQSKYQLKEIVVAHEQNYIYGLYQMSFK